MIGDECLSPLLHRSDHLPQIEFTAGKLIPLAGSLTIQMIRLPVTQVVAELADVIEHGGENVIQHRLQLLAVARGFPMCQAM